MFLGPYEDSISFVLGSPSTFILSLHLKQVKKGFFFRLSVRMFPLKMVWFWQFRTIVKLPNEYPIRIDHPVLHSMPKVNVFQWGFVRDLTDSINASWGDKVPNYNQRNIRRPIVRQAVFGVDFMVTWHLIPFLFSWNWSWFGLLALWFIIDINRLLRSASRLLTSVMNYHADKPNLVLHFIC